MDELFEMVGELIIAIVLTSDGKASFKGIAFFVLFIIAFLALCWYLLPQ
jgi:hypothetical protein